MSDFAQTVLVIDDERGPRESLRMLLKDRYTVLCADSVDGGLALLAEHQPDAIIMDIRMPGTNGIEGLRAIREKDDTVAVIMVTGFGTLETAQEAIRLGAGDYIKKPFDTSEMLEVVRRNVQKTRLERRRRLAETELTRLNRQLLEEMAQKRGMASLGQKTAEVMHDLRNPLTAVLGYVSLLSEELRGSRERLGERWQETAEYLATIEKSVQRCKDLTDMWLGKGKRPAATRTSVGLRELLDEVGRDARPLADRRRVALSVACEGAEPRVMADRLQLFRSLQNVVVNAVEAAPAETGKVDMRCRVAGDHAEVVVRDNGPGMTPEQQQRLFEPFFTTKGAGGTGLGLLITREVVEEHGGSIAVDSGSGRGTVVTIRLPLASG
jgi:signal transduction histidine kinase